MRGYPEVSPEIGYRLAGYADGESSFAITKQRSGNGARKISYGCAFIIQVRDDDLAAQRGSSRLRSTAWRRKSSGRWTPTQRVSHRD